MLRNKTRLVLLILFVLLVVSSIVANAAFGDVRRIRVANAPERRHERRPIDPLARDRS